MSAPSSAQTIVLAAGFHELAQQTGRRTDLVELEGVELCAGLGQQLLGGLAVGAVRLGEDGCAESAKGLQRLS